MFQTFDALVRGRDITGFVDVTGSRFVERLNQQCGFAAAGNAGHSRERAERNLSIDVFEIVVSGDTLEKKKPDPMPLLYVAEKLGVLPSESTMLGDSVSDVKAARAAGFEIICMSYGYNHGVDIRDAKPDAVIDSMQELQGLLESA